MQGIAEVFGFNLKKNKTIVALGRGHKGMQEVWGARSLGGWQGSERGLFQREIRGQDSLLPALALQKGTIIPHFCSLIYNKDTVLLLCQEEARGLLN